MHILKLQNKMDQLICVVFWLRAYLNWPKTIVFTKNVLRGILCQSGEADCYLQEASKLIIFRVNLTLVI